MNNINYWQELIIEIIVLIIFLQPMFSFGIFTGIGYIVAIVGAIRNGLLFKKRNMGRMVVGGTILTYVAGKIFFIAIGSENIVSIILIFVIASMFWLKGYFWKKGNPI
ncbi:hypothetical protein HYZ41_03190 [archaeon]|nr:hypothetical protein [archaeon]